MRPGDKIWQVMTGKFITIHLLKPDVPVSNFWFVIRRVK
jgi:hypothetical protein